MSFIDKILTEESEESNSEIAQSDISKNYQDIEGIKSSEHGFICRNMYIAKIENEDEGKLEFVQLF